MNLKQKLQKLGRKMFGIEDSASFGWRTISNNSTIKESNSFLEANIRAICTAFCNGELKLRDNSGEEIAYTTKGKNPLLDLMYQPAPFLTETLFKQIICSQFLIYGDVYILKTGRAKQNKPTILLPIPAPSVKVNYNNEGYPVGYRVNTKEGGYNVALEDMLHIYEGNAYKLFEGTPRVDLCKLDAETINAAKVFNLAFFENGASVGGIISFPDGVAPTKEQQTEMLAFFNDQYAGSAKAHRTAMLTRGGKYESYKTSHKDMEYSEGQKFSMQQIYSTMGVPPAMVGLFEYAPQFNTKEQQKIFYETNVMPIAKLFSDAFNEGLVEEFYKDESVYIEYDFSKVKALGREWGELATAATQLAALWPLNEVKKALDLPFSDVQGGDVPPNPILSAFSGLNANKLESDTKGAKKARLIRPTPAQLKRHKAGRITLFNDLGNSISFCMETHFESQKQAVLNYIKNNKDKSFDYGAVFGSIAQQTEKLLAVKIPAIADIFQKGIEFEQNYLQSLAPKKDFSFISKKSLNDRVEKWAKQYAFKWAESIEQTTFRELDAIISTFTKQGATNAEINNIVLQFFSKEGYEPTDVIVEEVGETYRKVSIYDRIQTIVQTETLATISESALEAFLSTPYVNGKGWITTMGVADHHIGHLEMDGQEVGVNDYFTNPITNDITKAPSQFGKADQDINCLCDIYPIVMVEE